MQALLEALEASSVAVWDYNVRTGRVWLSAEWSQMLGYGRVSGSTTLEALNDLVPVEERPALDICLGEALAGKRAEYRVEHRVRSKTGWVWILSCGRVVMRDSSGMALRMVGSNANVTAIKDAQAALTIKEEQLRLIIDAAPALIGYIDRKFEFRFHNRAYEDWLGLHGSEIDGRHLRDVIGEDAYAQTESYVVRALAGESVEFERVQPAAGGSSMHLAARYVPHAAVDGNVVGVVAVLTDITERKAMETKIAALALADPLTGLPNRRMLDERLSQALSVAARHKQSLALLYIDLDGFKPINDKLGHEAGDAVLVEVAHRLRAAVRESDTVARVGGDEFVVVLVDADAASATRKAERLIDEIRKPVTLPGAEVGVAASIGVAMYPQNGKLPQDLARCADAAMYEAKRAGRGICRLFNPL